MAKINEKVPEKKRGAKKKKETKVGRSMYLYPSEWKEVDAELGKDCNLGEVFYKLIQENKLLSNQLEETINP